MIKHYHDDPALTFRPWLKVFATTGLSMVNRKNCCSLFMALPKQYFLNGDPYHCECHKTARLVVDEQLGLEDDLVVPQLSVTSRLTGVVKALYRSNA